MRFFECCYKCVPPKRYPGCSGKCPEYKEQRELWDAAIAAERKRKMVPPAKTDWLNSLAYYKYRKR